MRRPSFFTVRAVLSLKQSLKASAMLDAIIFDAEGVIVDTESIWDWGQAEFLRRRGFAYDRERIKPLLTGRSLVDGVEVLKREYGFSGDAKALARERVEIVKDLFEHKVKFIDGFVKFYECVSGRYKTGVATSMAEDLLEVIDRRLKLSKLFGGRIFSLRHVGYRAKPDPALFLYAAEQLRSAPATCVVIEDAPLGIEAARNAGMKSIGLATTYDYQKLNAADVVVASYDEIDLAALERKTAAVR